MIKIVEKRHIKSIAEEIWDLYKRRTCDHKMNENYIFQDLH